VTDDTATDGVVIRNGKQIADLEYFLMGERGDMYRHLGWPNYVPTKYLVDPTAAYDVIDIHYAYVGANHSVQKSEKTLTIVCPTDEAAGTATLGTVATAVAGKVDTALVIELI